MDTVHEANNVEPLINFLGCDLLNKMCDCITLRLHALLYVHV